jgi:hypothetical protein
MIELAIYSFGRKTQVQLKTGEYKWLGDRIHFVITPDLKNNCITDNYKLEDVREKARIFSGKPPLVTCKMDDYDYWDTIDSISYFFEEGNWVVEFRRNPHLKNLGVDEFYLFKKYKEE